MSQTQIESKLDEKRDVGMNEDLEELVYQESNRFSAAVKFLDKANEDNLKPLKGLDWSIGKVATWLTYPLAYVFSLIKAKYSSEKRGYMF